MLTNHQRGSLRAKQLITLLEQHSVLDTDQIRLLLFTDVSERMCHKVLARLTEKGVIKRNRLAIDEPFYYYLNTKPGQIDHVLAISWVYVWFTLNLKSWEQIHCFDRKIEYRSGKFIIRPDGLVAIKNTWENTFRFYFIELDIANSGNKFDKITKYNTLYSTEGYLSSWWTTLTNRFPPIIIVTTGTEKRIRKHIKSENANNLEFKIYSLNWLKEGCTNGRSGNESVRTI